MRETAAASQTCSNIFMDEKHSKLPLISEKYFTSKTIEWVYLVDHLKVLLLIALVANSGKKDKK